MFRKWLKKRKEVDQPLSPEADAFLEMALEEFNSKQALLRENWRVGTQKNWGFDQEEGVLRLEFEDGAKLEADVQVLGTYSKSEGSLEWAWNNPNVFENMKKDSAIVRKLGKHLGIGYLQAGKIPVAGEQFVSYLSSIGLKATESTGVFRGKAGPIDVILLLKNPRWAN